MTTNSIVTTGILLKKISPTSTSYESETEDEEVRMNCIAGSRGVDEIGIYTTDESDSEDDFKETFAVVQFVKTRPTHLTCAPLVCPKATNPYVNRNLSPHTEGDSDALESLSAPEEMEAHHHDSRDDASLATETSESDDADTVLFSVASSNTFHLLVDCDDDCFELNGNMIACLFDGTETHFEIIESCGETCDIAFDDSESSDVHYIGVRVDSDPDESRLLQVKRSISTMVAVDNPFTEHTKRAKQSSSKEISVDETITSFFNVKAFPSEDLSFVCVRSLRDDTPVLLTSDDEDLDRQLGEELVDNYDTDEDRNGTPVPLLTPPGSPLTVEWEGNRATVCEWPSNLIVDNAMQAINELRPMSPDSLESLERYEQSRVETMFAGVSGTGGATLFHCVRA